MHDLAPNESN
jgi:hypothetical protein